MRNLLGGAQPTIRSWRAFESKVRSQGCRLLCMLDNYPRAILVAGCQRSGTTALSRLITQSEGMTEFSFGKDDELDAALILSGTVPLQNAGRVCFQTTYLNNCMQEYFEHQDYQLIWVVRTPFSVVYSMLHNWKTAALNRLFRTCAVPLLEGREKRRYQRYGIMSIPQFRRACLAYNAKASQLVQLRRQLSQDRLFVVDYDMMVREKHIWLPAIYDFVGLQYREEYANRIHSRSVDKAKRLGWRRVRIIEETCLGAYEASKALVSKLNDNSSVTLAQTSLHI